MGRLRGRQNATNFTRRRRQLATNYSQTGPDTNIILQTRPQRRIRVHRTASERRDAGSTIQGVRVGTEAMTLRRLGYSTRPVQESCKPAGLVALVATHHDRTYLGLRLLHLRPPS